MTIRSRIRTVWFTVGLLVAASLGAGCQRDGASRQELLRYVSLGDSFPAGAGLPDATGPCRRSASAYPSLLARTTNLLPSLHACSGATTLNVLEQEQHAGERRQLDWVVPDTDVVTITIGGNDVGFSRILGSCLTGTESCSRLEQEVDDRIADLTSRLNAINREIKRRLPRVRLLVVGYPHVIADPRHVDVTACVDVTASRSGAITADEAEWLRRKGDDLNSRLRESAQSAAARYVDAAGAFAGHEACSGAPWMRGLVSENLSASFHPNEVGHEALARLIAKTVGFV